MSEGPTLATASSAVLPLMEAVFSASPAAIIPYPMAPPPTARGAPSSLSNSSEAFASNGDLPSAELIT